MGVKGQAPLYHPCHLTTQHHTSPSPVLAEAPFPSLEAEDSFEGIEEMSLPSPSLLAPNDDRHTSPPVPSNGTKLSQAKEQVVGETSVPPTLTHKSSEPADSDAEEDLVLGLCPEDFSFGLHDTSAMVYEITANELTSSSNATCEEWTATEPPKRSKNTSSRSKKRQQCYPLGTFYGLPTKVLKCLTTHRGITELYGNIQ